MVELYPGRLGGGGLAGQFVQCFQNLGAAFEVGPGLFFSLLIITVSFLPVFALTGQSFKLFAPLDPLARADHIFIEELMKQGYFKVAEAYILYRAERARKREASLAEMAVFHALPRIY